MTLACKTSNSNVSLVEDLLQSCYYELATLGVSLSMSTKKCQKNTYYYLWVKDTVGSLSDQIMTKNMSECSRILGSRNCYVDITDKVYRKAIDF